MALGPQEELDIRLNLQGSQAFIAETNAASASVSRLGAASEVAGRGMEHAGRRSFLMNQALFTLRRVAYGSTLALGAAGAGAIAWGIKFNATMEQNQVAFEYFTGSTTEATQELDKLYNLAALTPFEFPQLVDASRKFLAFGFSVDQTNAIMTTLGDTIAGLGLGAEGIDRAVLAIGQMHAAGRVLGGEIRQLTELGIPALQILQEQLGLTNDQIARIGELRIPADVAIAALVKGLNQRFQGMAEQQSKTFMGQISTLRDYTAQTLGTLTEALFKRLTGNLLPTAIKVMKATSEGFKAGGWDEAVRRVDAVVGAQGRLYDGWKKVSAAAHDFWIIFSKELWPALKDTAVLVGTILYPFLILLAKVMDIAAKHTTTFQIALTLLFYWLVLDRMATIALVVWEKRKAFWTAVNNLLTRTSTRLIKIQIFWMGLLAIATEFLTVLTKGYVRGAGGQFTSMTKVGKVALWLRTGFLRLIAPLSAVVAESWAFTASLLANPITWIVLAVIALIAALVTLYIKWDRFHRAVDRTYHFIRDHWIELAPLLAIVLGPLVIMAATAVKLWHALRDVYHWMKRLKNMSWKDLIPGVDWLGKIGGALNYLPGVGIATGIAGLFHQHGGMIPMGGMGFAGEAGMEMITVTPGGARITPMGAGRPLDIGAILSGAMGNLSSHSHLYLDGRQVAESTAKYNLATEARS